MQNTKILVATIFLALVTKLSPAQDSATIQLYISSYKDLAIAEMQRTGVPAAITLAQGIHETLAGTSDLVKMSNNHFGIKCKDTWNGPSVKHTDDARNECFRKYSSANDSYRDHSDFLKGSPRYVSLFDIDPTDYKDWAYGLKKAGYATNPRYAEVIIKLIEDYNLQDYTMIAMGKMPPKEDVIAKTTIQDETRKDDALKVYASSKAEPVSVTKDGFLNMEMQVKKPTPTADNVQQLREEPLKTEIKQVEKPIEQPKYPDGEFKINETRVVFVKAGTSFLAIAQQYNISLAWLFDFNDMKQKESVDKDQLIYLQRKRKTGNNEYHFVKEGETLYDIAQSEAIRIESLLEYNMLSANTQPAIGEQLYLKTKAPTPRLVLNKN